MLSAGRKIVFSVFLLSVVSFSVLAKDPPIITEFIPPAGPVGTEVKVNGQHFSGEPSDNKVRLGKTILKATASYPNQIRVKIPKKAKTGKISVEVEHAGKAVSEKEFVVMAPLKVTSFSDSHGPPGGTITIQGAGFSTTPAHNKVTIGDAKCRVLKATATELKIKLPKSPTKGRFTIDVKYNTKKRYKAEFLVANNPVLRNFTPTEGVPGAEVEIRGMHFGTDPKVVDVRLGGKAAHVLSVKDKKIVVEVPKGASSGVMELTVNDLASEPSTRRFEVLEALAPTKMDPLKAFRGNEVRVFGRGFAPRPVDNKLKIGEVVVPGNRLEEGAVVFVLPADAPLGEQQVVLKAKMRGSFNVPVPLTVMEAAAVTGFKPGRGAAGEVVTIKGKNFGNSSNTVRVVIGGKYAYIRDVTPTKIVVNIPSGAASSPITVETRYNGSAVSRKTLKIEAPVVVTVSRFAPTYGVPNQQIRLYGEGFSANNGENKVALGSVSCKVLQSQDNSILVQLPPNAASDIFRVWVGKTGYAESSSVFTVTPPGNPPPPPTTPY